MSILIHERAGRRIIFYQDDRHLRQYAVACPTLISVEIWPDPASAENALRDGLVGKMIRTHLEPQSFSSRSRGNRTEDCQEACREFGVIESNGERRQC
jgi:hypothetical protein